MLSAMDCLLFQDKLAFIASFKIYSLDFNYPWQKSENLARFVFMLEKQEMIKDSSWIFITVLVIASGTIYGGRTEAYFIGECRMFWCLLSIHSKLKLENSNIIREVPVTCYRLPGLCWTWGSFPVCHERRGKKTTQCLRFVVFNRPVFPQTSRVHILDTETFETTFGPKSQRKRPTLSASDVQSLVENAEASSESYDQSKDRDLVTEDTGVRWLERKNDFIVYMYEKPALFLKKYLVPPSICYCVRRKEKEISWIWDFGWIPALTWASSSLLSVNALRAEKKILTLYLWLLMFLVMSSRDEAQEEIFKKGQSKRIWGELYKVNGTWNLQQSHLSASAQRWNPVQQQWEKLKKKRF